jgi:hypothetical protein
MLVLDKYHVPVAANHTKSVRIDRSFSWMDAYPTPIAEILYFAISFRSLLSPLDDGEFESVKVLKSAVGGRTSDSYTVSTEANSRAGDLQQPSDQVEQM